MTTTSATEKPSRDLTVDVARGLAIIAIVVGHVWRGLLGADLIAKDRTYFLVDSGLYFFHLAVFVFISGLFVPGGIQRRGSGPYVRSRVVLFLYLYLVWSLIQGAVKVASGSLSNDPLELSELLALWTPQGQLWYLPFMAIMTALVAAYQPWQGRGRWVAVGIAGAASFAAWGVEGSVVGARGLSLTVFFFLGAALGAKRVLPWLDRVGVGRALALGALASAAYLVLLLNTSAQTPTVVDGHRTMAEVLLGLTTTVLGGTAVLMAAIATARIPAVGTVLAVLGRRSLEIFLAHIVVASGARILLAQSGVSSGAIHLAVGTLLGLSAPLLLTLAARRWPVLALLFVPPRRR